MLSQKTQYGKLSRNRFCHVFFASPTWSIKCLHLIFVNWRIITSAFLSKFFSPRFFFGLQPSSDFSRARDSKVVWGSWAGLYHIFFPYYLKLYFEIWKVLLWSSSKMFFGNRVVRIVPTGAYKKSTFFRICCEAGVNVIFPSNQAFGFLICDSKLKSFTCGYSQNCFLKDYQFCYSHPINIQKPASWQLCEQAGILCSMLLILFKWTTLICCCNSQVLSWRLFTEVFFSEPISRTATLQLKYW